MFGDVVNQRDDFNKTDYSLYNRHKLYKQGVERFNQEIDLVHYTKSLRLLKTLLSSLMDGSEKNLSIYQHQNCLKLINWDMWNWDIKHQENEMPKLIGDLPK